MRGERLLYESMDICAHARSRDQIRRGIFSRKLVGQDCCKQGKYIIFYSTLRRVVQYQHP